MISNITNTLPTMLKHMQKGEQIKNPEFNLMDSINFYKSILPKKKEMEFLKHLHLDCVFKVKEEYNSIVSDFNVSIDTMEFLKDFYYEANPENGLILIRSNYEELAILSMILIGSIKELQPYFDLVNYEACEYCFSTVYMWQHAYKTGYVICDDFAVIMAESEGDTFSILPLAKSEKIPEAIDFIIDYF